MNVVLEGSSWRVRLRAYRARYSDSFEMITALRSSVTRKQYGRPPRSLSCLSACSQICVSWKMDSFSQGLNISDPTSAKCNPTPPQQLLKVYCRETLVDVTEQTSLNLFLFMINVYKRVFWKFTHISGKQFHVLSSLQWLKKKKLLTVVYSTPLIEVYS